ncbi:hypothetical protein BDV23DRAFT_177980 [Aspergillus alliaceus]|uniref:Uncharacterized protein n=1 Tax=Petromyces alliaceus TaxID=209559 RepID=A0A5N7CP86_PETAA|nr:hypothetical protein BDV23DRAFT_177980 [Aspergillus alliaceus]
MVEANTKITCTCIPMLKYSIQRLIPQFRWNSKGTTGTNGRFQGNSHGLQYFSAKTRRVTRMLSTKPPSDTSILLQSREDELVDGHSCERPSATSGISKTTQVTMSYDRNYGRDL